MLYTFLGDIMENLKNIVVTEIVDIISIYSEKGRFLEIKNRESYGFSFCKEGRITYTHNGKKFVSDNQHIVILPQNQTYTLKGNKTGTFPVINFKCNKFFADEFLVFPTKKVETYITEFEEMKRLNIISDNNMKIMSIFYNMLHRLITENTLCQTIAPAVRYIEENYKSENLSNKALADICNISEIYLRKLFIKHLKTTPKQYISEIRLQKAKHLLKEGALKINAVSEECGFQSSYNFCRFFKEKTGLTPTEFMKKNANYKI